MCVCVCVPCRRHRHFGRWASSMEGATELERRTNPQFTMIHDTFGCFDNAYDLFGRHLGRTSPISFRTSNCTRCRRSRTSAHLWARYCSRPGTIHESRSYCCTGRHGPETRPPNRHDTLEPAAYICTLRRTICSTNRRGGEGGGEPGRKYQRKTGTDNNK